MLYWELKITKQIFRVNTLTVKMKSSEAPEEVVQHIQNTGNFGQSGRRNCEEAAEKSKIKVRNRYFCVIKGEKLNDKK